MPVPTARVAVCARIMGTPAARLAQQNSSREKQCSPRTTGHAQQGPCISQSTHARHLPRQARMPAHCIQDMHPQPRTRHAQNTRHKATHAQRIAHRPSAAQPHHALPPAKPRASEAPEALQPPSKLNFLPLPHWPRTPWYNVESVSTHDRHRIFRHSATCMPTLHPWGRRGADARSTTGS